MSFGLRNINSEPLLHILVTTNSADGRIESSQQQPLNVTTTNTNINNNNNVKNADDPAFPNNSTGHVSSSLVEMYRQRMKRETVKHDSIYDTHAIKSALTYLLEVVGQDTDNYCESYSVRHDATSPALVFSGCYIPESLRSNEQVLNFSATAGASEYLPGIGLPAIGVSVERRRSHLGIIIVYSPLTINHQASLTSYLDAVCGAAEGMSALMAARTVLSRKGKNRLRQNLRFLRIVVQFLGIFLVAHRKKKGQSLWARLPLRTATGGGLTRSASGSLLSSLVLLFNPSVRPSPSSPLQSPPSPRQAPPPQPLLSSSSPLSQDAGAFDQRDYIPAAMEEARIERILLQPESPELVSASSASSSHGKQPFATALNTASAVFPSDKSSPKPASPICTPSCATWLQHYTAKLKGGSVNMPKRTALCDAAVSFFGVFVAVACTMLMFGRFSADTVAPMVLPASFGALATLIFALPEAPLAQPRVLLPAHIISVAMSTIVVYVFHGAGRIGQLVWLQTALSCASSITCMALCGVVHPPAGAISIIVVATVNQSSDVSGQVLLYLFLSIFFALFIFTLVAVVVDNISSNRTYPAFW